jgi:hypothetical protein
MGTEHRFSALSFTFTAAAVRREPPCGIIAAGTPIKFMVDDGVVLDRRQLAAQSAK